jgi:uncharacterized protein
MKKAMLIAAGSLALALGVIGIFLPLLPTTPFLILAASCYIRSSTRLYNWLLQHKILGRYIGSYMKYKAITLKAKIISAFTLWLFIAFSAIFIVDFLWLRFVLFGVAITVSLIIFSIRTLDKKELIECS